MANIATVFVRVQPVDGAEVAAEEVLGLLMDPGRGSYHVPVWHRAGVVDVQYGARWSGVSAVEQIWDGIGERLRSVWVRYLDSGADFDRIGHRTAGLAGTVDWRICEYWYDEVRLIPAGGGEPWRAEGLWLRRAENDRSVLGDAQLDSPTTPASAYPWRDFLGQWRSYGVADTVLDAIGSTIDSLERAELWSRGRPVEVAQRVGPGPGRAWARWSLDDWDSCADAEYVEHFGG
ncbi:hypothetical protein ACQP00_16140 [Dactylosporangium sp. CS-047395]|uniref:hypothetical protein n=1 Tax=Dactylosporangium sp. CS-047395 TaxID=3239936 RepID=UPI003D8EB17A